MTALSTNPRVLLSTVFRRFHGDYFDVADTATYRYPKTNAPYRVSSGLRFIKQNVPEVEVLEYPLWHEYVTKLKEGWDVVGFSFYNVTMGEFEKMVKEARRQGVREIWAGNYGALDPHAQSLVDRTFIGPAEDQVAQVFGYRVREDEIEHPPMIMRAYLMPGKVPLLLSGLLYTQHGCPYNCTFCQASVFEKKRFTISLEGIERVLRFYRNKGVNYIAIMDETFGSNPEFSDRVTELLARNGFCWWAQTRVEIIQRHLDCWYKRGLRMPAIGVECMFQSSLNSVNKGQRIQEIIDYARRSSDKPGMFRIIYYMIGFENMKAEEVIADARQVSELGFEMAVVGIITPYPQTPLWHDIDSKYGIFDTDHRHYDNEHLVWNHPTLSPDEMNKLRIDVLELLNRPTDVYLKKYIRRLFRKGPRFLWRYLLKGPLMTLLADDRKQIFFSNLRNNGSVYSP